MDLLDLNNWCSKRILPRITQYHLFQTQTFKSTQGFTDHESFCFRSPVRRTEFGKILGSAWSVTDRPCIPSKERNGIGHFYETGFNQFTEPSDFDQNVKWAVIKSKNETGTDLIQPMVSHNSSHVIKSKNRTRSKNRNLTIPFFWQFHREITWQGSTDLTRIEKIDLDGPSWKKYFWLRP